MKVRIGLGLGRGGASAGLEALAGDVVALGFDSIWLSEVLTAPGHDPLVALAFLAAAQRGLKLGTTMLLPGRNVVRLAKQVASLDRLSGGRLLVTFVPGLVTEPERDAIGVAPRDRPAAIDEALPLLRRLLAGERVSHDGTVARFSDVEVAPLPVQRPLEFWLGGMALASLVRCGRLGDGWLPSQCTPAEAAAGRAVIEEAAAEAGRVISPEHFGVSLGYVTSEAGLAAQASRRGRGRGHEPAELVPLGLTALRDRLGEFIEVGFSKFVVRPLEARPELRGELEALAGAVLPLQS